MEQEQPSYVALYCTTRSMDEASQIGQHLVGNHIAACVNVIPNIRSIFWWNNKVYQDSEVLMIIKTQTNRIPEVENSIRQLHSYENPELIALPIQYGIPEYMNWMAESLAFRDQT